MELRHLRYFVVLAEELHFGRAALRLNITQPPLSFNIRQLEEELGLRLFDRDHRRVVLTEPGRAFLAEARNILEHSHRAKNIARAASQGLSGWLNVSFSGSLIYAELPYLIKAFAAKFPDVEVNLVERYRAEQLDDLMHNRIDAGFMDSPNVPEDLEGLLLCDDEFICCVPHTHPMAGKSSIDLKSLAKDLFVMFPREGAPSQYDRIVSICIEAGFEPKMRMASRHWLSIIAMVARGFGIALVPARLANTGMADVCFIPLKKSPSIRSRGYLIWDPKRIVPAMASFIEFMRENMTQDQTPTHIAPVDKNKKTMSETSIAMPATH